MEQNNNLSIRTVTSHPIRSLWKVSIPVILVGVVETLYYVVDTIYVGRIGPDALAAITFFGPLYFVMLAVSLGINAGLGSRISRLIGQKKKKEAENTATLGLISGVLLGIIVSVLLLLFGKMILSAAGASGNILALSWKYSWIMILSSIFMFGAYILNSVFVAQGDSKTAMILDICSLGLNIILTPIFIFVCNWGISGAAIGTLLSLVFGFCQSLYFMHTRSTIKLHYLKFKFDKKALYDIISVGFPASLSMLIIAVYMFFLNGVFAFFSTNHVAAFGIINKLEMVVILPLYGLSVGAMTICGMLYGAKKYSLLSKVSWYATWIGAGISAAIGLFFILFSSFFLKIFTSDPLVLAIAFPLLIFDVFTFPTMAIIMITTRSMQGMGHGMPAFIIHLIRIIGFAIPLAYLFVYVFHGGYLWIGAAMVISGTLGAGIAMLWQRQVLNVIHRKP